MTATSLFVYFKERFPIAGVAFLSFTFALFIFGIEDVTFGPLKVTLLGVVFAAFLLRQRVIDEFKDNRHDSRNFPGRPFQRGLISTRGLVVLGVCALGIEFLAVYFVGGVAAILWYMPVFAYSLLMAKEFFVSGWLTKHFTIYFLLHEVVFVGFALWLLAAAGAQYNARLFAWVVAFVSLMMGLEVARKFELRKNPQGAVVKDTYTAVWGRANTVIVLQFLMMVTGIGLSYAESCVLFAVSSSVAALLVGVFAGHSKRVIAVMVAHVVALLVGLVLL